MNPGRFFMPGYTGMRNIPMSRMAGMAPRGMGLFSRITNGIRSVNWSGILTNANKTINVVNQAIPLVRQAGPMVSNVKSMLKIAKAFGGETRDTRNRSNGNIDYKNNVYNIPNNSNSQSINNGYYNENRRNNNNLDNEYRDSDGAEKKEVDDNAPNFFI